MYWLSFVDDEFSLHFQKYVDVIVGVMVVVGVTELVGVAEILGVAVIVGVLARV